MSHPMLDDLASGSEREVLSSDPVVAWRRWRIRPDEAGLPILASAHEDQFWPTRTLLAECDPVRTWSYRLTRSTFTRHCPPAAGCRCGIHAYRTPEQARPMAPGVWVYGQVLVGGPMFETDTGYRGRQATIDGPLEMVIECVGGDDLISPTRCFKTAVQVKYDSRAYYPVCSSHSRAPVDVAVAGTYEVGEFAVAASGLAARLGTVVATPA